jgi:hypothetical protein
MPASQYPVSYDDDTTLYKAVNSFATLLTSSINASQTTISVASVTGLPATGLVSIDSEIIAYSGFSSSPSPQLTGCIRGFDDTTALIHGASARVEMRWVADHHNSLASAIKSTQHAVGINPQDVFSSLAERLSLTLPVTIPITIPSTDWSFTHDRKRVVSIQLYKKVGPNVYDLFDANIQQSVDTLAVSEVEIILPEACQGYIVFQ